MTAFSWDRMSPVSPDLPGSQCLEGEVGRKPRASPGWVPGFMVVEPRAPCLRGALGTWQIPPKVGGQEDQHGWMGHKVFPPSLMENP